MKEVINKKVKLNRVIENLIFIPCNEKPIAMPQ